MQFGKSINYQISLESIIKFFVLIKIQNNMQLIILQILLLITIHSHQKIQSKFHIQDLVLVDELTHLILIILEEMLVQSLLRLIILNKISMNFVHIDLIDGMNVTFCMMIKKLLTQEPIKSIHVIIFIMKLNMLVRITFQTFYLNWLIQEEPMESYLKDISMMIYIESHQFMILL